MDASNPVRFLQQENNRLKQERKDLEAQIESQANYIEAISDLYWIAKSLDTEANLYALMDELMGGVLEVIEASDGSMSLLDNEDELVFTIVHGAARSQLPGYRIKTDTGVAGWVFREAEPLIVNNPRQDWRFSLLVDTQFDFSTRSILCVPIQDEAGEVIGVLQMLNKRLNNFGDADIRLATILADIAAQAMAEMDIRTEIANSLQ